MDTVVAFFSELLTTLKELLLGLPADILFLGVIVGFLVASIGWGRSSRRYAKGLLGDICNSSSTLALTIALCMFIYMITLVSLKAAAYYTVAFALGFFVCLILQAITNLIYFIGRLFALVLALVSGPLVIISSWLFHTGQLASTVRGFLP